MPRSARVRILLGPSKGLRWVVGSGAHGYWIGVYELEKRRIVEKHLRPGDVFYDIGAHVGYFTLVASRLVGEDGFVVAVEPDPDNATKLREHLQLNGISNVKLVQAACSRARGTAPFSFGDNSSTGRLNETGQISVATISIDDLARECPPPTVLKIDAEGGEFDILSGAEETLTSIRPVVILSTHGRDQEVGTRKLLEAKNYRLEPLTGFSEEFIALPETINVSPGPS